MNKRIISTLAVALIVALAASYLVTRLVQRNAKAAPSAAATPVIVAAKNLEIGTLLRDEDLRTGAWSGPLLKGMATKKDGLVGRGVVADVFEGEPVMESRLAAPGAGGGLAAIIPAGMRACAVRVNDLVGVGGFVVSGMRVDVLASAVPPGPGASSGSKVKTILQNIEVLSAGTNYQKDAEGKPVQVPVVNLLVTPEQAEILSLVASNETRVQLVLRNRLDTQISKTTGTAMANLFGDAKAPAPPVSERPRKAVVATPKPAPAPPAVQPVLLIEVFNGARRAEYKINPRPEEKQ